LGNEVRVLNTDGTSQERSQTQMGPLRHISDDYPTFCTNPRGASIYIRIEYEKNCSI